MAQHAAQLSSKTLALCFILVMMAATRVIAQESLLGQAQTYFAPLPTAMESKDNPITPDKVRLGKMLFYETRISVDRTVSCFKCHLISLYATDGLRKAIGNNYRLNPRNAPAVLNAAGQISEHWIGNRISVEDQAKQALIAQPSFGLASYQEAERLLKAIPGYIGLFQAAFPNEQEPVNADNFALAVGAWERTLVTPSRFDSFLNRDSLALSEQEQLGLRAFIESACISCHSGPFLGGQMYDKFGITQPYWNLTHSKEIDVGRFAVTNKEQDKYVFKVAILRNVEMTAPYFHDGSVDNLTNAVTIMARLQIGIPVDTTKASQIVAFLKSLTGQIPEDALKVPILPSEN